MARTMSSVATPSARPAAFVASERLFGIGFDRLALDEVLRLMAERAEDAPFAYVVTPNVDHIVRLMDAGDTLAPIYRNAWLRLCDSRILRLVGLARGVALERDVP